jgi:AraC family transcriptional regulator of adaptative response/methylated-DNA-[protein]-cysteine methyltransferase
MENQHHYRLMADALHWLCENQASQPNLEELATAVGLSPTYVQRLFQDWVGVSPKQFLKSLTKTQAIERLRNGETVLECALSSGLSGPGRLHDLLVTTVSTTPGEAKRKGHGVRMHHGYVVTPFGEALLAWTDRGISFLGFCQETGREHAWFEFTRQWPDTTLVEDNQRAEHKLTEIFSGTEGKPLKVWLRGSPFQLKIWEALLELPPGTHCTYGQLATLVGRNGAHRATGSAVGRNPVSWLIPCHRVINSLGGLGGYRWGLNTKQAIIGYEAAKRAQMAT